MIRTEEQIKNNPYLNQLKAWYSVDPTDKYGSRAIEILEECMRNTPIPEGTYNSLNKKKKEKLFSDSGKNYNDGNFYDEHHIWSIAAGGSKDDPENRVFIPNCEEYPWHTELHLCYYFSTTLFPRDLHKCTVIPARLMSNNFSLTSEQAGKLNEEFRQTMSECLEDPKIRQRLSESCKKHWEDPEFRKSRSESTKKQWEDPEFRQTQSESSKKRWKDPEFRHKLSKTRRKNFLQKTGFILKFDKNNNLLEIFDRPSNHPYISKVISGERKTCEGYFWAAEKKNWPSFLESIKDPVKKQELIDRFEELKKQYYESNSNI